MGQPRAGRGRASGAIADAHPLFVYCGADADGAKKKKTTSSCCRIVDVYVRCMSVVVFEYAPENIVKCLNSPQPRGNAITKNGRDSTNTGRRRRAIELAMGSLALARPGEPAAA